jgi:hypothetical protein
MRAQIEAFRGLTLIMPEAVQSPFSGFYKVLFRAIEKK